MKSTLSRDYHTKKFSVAFSPQADARFYAALTVAGSDSGGGAGIQADLKAFAASGVYGTSAITALTAQNSSGVQQIVLTRPAMLMAQMRAVLSDYPIRAAKTGMLGSAALCAAAAQVFAEYPGVQLVVDPVLIATTGARLSSQRTLQRMRKVLIPQACVLTPNLPEAEVLLGRTINGRGDMLAAAEALLGFGCRAVLLKGGHLSGSHCHDLYLDASMHFWASSPRLALRGHGTGCTLAALITAQLARGADPLSACRIAITRLRRYLRHAEAAGTGALSSPDPFWPTYRTCAMLS